MIVDLGPQDSRPTTRRRSMRTITVQERQRRLVRQHHLDGGATSPEAVVDALVALHATDPASVYLAVLARSAASTLADVSEAMYVRRNLVRWMAMRRTLFLFARADIPVVQAAVGTRSPRCCARQLSASSRASGPNRQLTATSETGSRTLRITSSARLRARKEATGAQLGADVPGLRTLIPPGAPSDRPQNVTSALLTLMSTEGRIVRGVPAGALDQPSSPLGTCRALVAHGAPATGRGRVAATSGMAMASPLRSRDRRGPAVVDRLEQGRASAGR